MTQVFGNASVGRRVERSSNLTIVLLVQIRRLKGSSVSKGSGLDDPSLGSSAAESRSADALGDLVAWEGDIAAGKAAAAVKLLPPFTCHLRCALGIIGSQRTRRLDRI